MDEVFGTTGSVMSTCAREGGSRRSWGRSLGGRLRHSGRSLTRLVPGGVFSGHCVHNGPTISSARECNAKLADSPDLPRERIGRSYLQLASPLTSTWEPPHVRPRLWRLRRLCRLPLTSNLVSTDSRVRFAYPSVTARRLRFPQTARPTDDTGSDPSSTSRPLTVERESATLDGRDPGATRIIR